MITVPRHFLLILFVLSSFAGMAHPMPHSVMLLSLRKQGIQAELSLPLKEFQFVYPSEDLDKGYLTLIQRKGKWLDSYLLKHLSIHDSQGNPWKIFIEGKSVSEEEQTLTGSYHELKYHLWLQPPKGISPRRFTMNYDVIMHQLVTHKLFIRVKSDWYGGMTEKDSLNADLGVLMVNPGDGKIQPVVVNLDEGSTWKGLTTMIGFGMEHIREGTDHLLFLLVLLLPASLVVKNKRWKDFGGSRYTAKRLLKIVTAFTIGHSVTLILGSLGWLRLPSGPVEIIIAVSIFVSAVHALRPIFSGYEVYVVLFFGFIHGMAFADTLENLDLDSGQMAWSILGFNIGIELMQLFVLLLTVPWLVILSEMPFYKFIRIGGAVFALLASLGWMLERITGEPNVITQLVEALAAKSKWLVLVLAVAAIGSYLFKKSRGVRLNGGE